MRACLILLLAVVVSVPAALASKQPAQSFTVRNGQFLLDGKPFQIVSGAIHYERIPQAYWRSRLRMAKAMGLNTIATYVFWNVHEPQPGVFNFSGNEDVAEFVREAQQEGLYVILRAGPYACAEWEFGGLPAWLLKDPTTRVRTRDPKFLAAAHTWLMRLGKELAPLQIGNGGPIIIVQAENEYGSYGDDHAYMEDIHHMLLQAGFTKAVFDTADGADEVLKGGLPEVISGIDFGPGHAQSSFAELREKRPGNPMWASEYWDGWFDHWGEPFVTTDAAQQAKDLDWMLSQGYSVNLYMFEGGTSFGWMNGANDEGKGYQPQITSYNYDAPLNESGRPTAKYFEFRKIIAKDTGVTPPPVPSVPLTASVPPFTLTDSVSLWKTLPNPIHSEQPLTMEDIGQAYGYILYRTEVNGPVSGNLKIDTLHDYAQVYLNGRLQGTIDRRLGQHNLPLDITGHHARLDILVENTGRVNYGPMLQHNRTGIVGGVSLGGKPLTGWEIYPLPMRSPGKLHYRTKACSGACFYRASFQVAKPLDTFLDTDGLYKGQVWVNGHNLGRFWNIGPQKTLYVPGPWLRQGTNKIVIFSLKAKPGAKLQGLDHPILDAPVLKPPKE